MSNLLEEAYKFARKASLDSECGVNGCNNTQDLELIWLKPLDPIDHEETPITLCPGHQEWADERNAFAEMIGEKLREYRAELGKEHMDALQELAHPQEENLSEDFLMGDSSEAPEYMDNKVVEE